MKIVENIQSGVLFVTRFVVRLSVFILVTLFTIGIFSGDYNIEKDKMSSTVKEKANWEEKVSGQKELLKEQKDLFSSIEYVAYTGRLEQEKAAAEAAAAEKAEAERIAAERIAAEKAAAEKAAAEKLAAERAAAEAKAKAKQEGVRIGMTQQEVRDSSWGAPKKINRTTNSYGVSEQWVYNGYNYLYFDNGILTSIQN